MQFIQPTVQNVSKLAPAAWRVYIGRPMVSNSGIEAEITTTGHHAGGNRYLNAAASPVAGLSVASRALQGSGR